MNAPDDFGLDSRETLAHVGCRIPASGHGPFWQRWAESVWSRDPRLEPLDPDSKEAREAGDPGVTHLFESRRYARIGGRLVAPTDEPEGVVLQLHGYESSSPLDDASPWSDLDHIAVFKLRVRGYPGSQLDTGDLRSHPGGWITHGLDAGADWILFDAIADVVNAFRALRAHYAPNTRISISGESFGGGLAIIAAAQIIGRDHLFRMCIGLPTFGDWLWRLAHATEARVGSGAEVLAFLRARPELEERIVETLRMADSVVHAGRCLCPVLCKLATRDEVVPAPTAAAVYNAIAASPGMKWRFLTRYGHFDGGIADLRRHALFERLATHFLDPREDLLELMHRWNDVLSDLSAVSPPAPSTA